MRFNPLVPATALALCSLPAGAIETGMQLVLTLDGNAQYDVVVYQCEESDDLLTVEYVNAHPIFLALLPVEGEKRIFVNVISASGARYASGPHVWWTSGPDAQLIDETAPEATEPLTCHEMDDTP